ncbi:MAG: type II toxin-antitoxin system PemK/MazF family toxin [Acidobacteria bacterium]|nr:type II toxin-antitoxin system PemK/MazF family toxin [Acidobacteriota bacterium]
MAIPLPGEVWLADLGMAGKLRPVIVVSRWDLDAPRALAICVPVTTCARGSNYEVALPRLGIFQQDSVANVQGIQSLPYPRLTRRIGKLPPEVLLDVRLALAWAIDARTN